MYGGILKDGILPSKFRARLNAFENNNYNNNSLNIQGDIMTKDIVYRHEIKYIISPIQMEILEKRMGEFAYIDEHAEKKEYHIRSLYFDDLWETAYYEKKNGVNCRKKWRIRIYDYNMETIKLECKYKKNKGIYKDSVLISQQDYRRIVHDDAEVINGGEKLLQKFYIEMNNYRLSPKIIVDYERVPYVFDCGNVRITFDKNIRAGIGSYTIEDDKIPMLDVFTKGEVILEVKYTHFIPMIFQDILFGEVGNEIATSKYVMCYEKMKKLYE